MTIMDSFVFIELIVDQSNGKKALSCAYRYTEDTKKNKEITKRTASFIDLFNIIPFIYLIH